MAKGDMGGTATSGAGQLTSDPSQLAALIARMKATNGGGQMGPGQFGGGMMPQTSMPSQAQGMPLPPSTQQRPMMGGFTGAMGPGVSIGAGGGMVDSGTGQPYNPGGGDKMQNPYNPGGNTGFAGGMQRRKLDYVG